jgi:hypothetical protein
MVCLIGADIGLGVEAGPAAPAAEEGREQRAVQTGQAALTGSECGGERCPDAAEMQPSSNAAVGVSGAGGLSYQYDALGRIKAIVRLPGN